MPTEAVNVAVIGPPFDWQCYYPTYLWKLLRTISQARDVTELGHRRQWRIAFISDPHADLVALDKVVSGLETARPVDEVLIGGDLAQGGAQPGEVVDEIRKRGWRSVRCNADDFLVRLADGTSAVEVLREAEAAHGVLPQSVACHAEGTVSRLGSERIEYLRSLPMSIVRGPFAFGTVMLVHATLWSTEDVVLPDADQEIAERMVREAGARLRWQHQPEGPGA